MKDNRTLTKILAVTGTLLLWLPPLAAIAFCVVSLLSDGKFRLDYMIPGEVFPIVLVGGVLLFWAAIRVRAYRRLIGWSLAAAVILLVGGQALAVATGLADGTAQQPELWMPFAMGSIILYDLGIIVAGVAGVLLLRVLFGTPRPSAPQ